MSTPNHPVFRYGACRFLTDIAVFVVGTVLIVAVASARVIERSRRDRQAPYLKTGWFGVDIGAAPVNFRSKKTPPTRRPTAHGFELGSLY